MDIRTIRIGDYVKIAKIKDIYRVESIIGNENSVYVYEATDEQAAIMAVKADELIEAPMTHRYLKAIGCTEEYKQNDVVVYGLDVEDENPVVIVFSEMAGMLTAHYSGHQYETSTLRDFQHFMLDVLDYDDELV